MPMYKNNNPAVYSKPSGAIYRERWVLLVQINAMKKLFFFIHFKAIYLITKCLEIFFSYDVASESKLKQIGVF